MGPAASPHQLAESRTFEEAKHDDDALNLRLCILSQAVSRTELDSLCVLALNLRPREPRRGDRRHQAGFFKYLAYQHSIIVRQHRQARALFARVFGSIHLPPPLLTVPRFFIV